ncbi:MAG TPA: hypothetical protein DDW52_06050 [Planctomycetaceae bacterium]|nr:hypothetical protein [Planctomycetaceae bacterium]
MSNNPSDDPASAGDGPADSFNPFAATNTPQEVSPNVPLDHRPNLGMFSAVTVVCILQFVLGGLEMLVAAALAFGSVGSSLQSGADIAALIGMGVFSAVIGVSAVLRIVSGIFGLRYRRWGLMVGSLIYGFCSLFTCYCSLFSLVTGILGLVVMFDGTVQQAFRLGAEGLDPNAIRSRIRGY